MRFRDHLPAAGQCVSATGIPQAPNPVTTIIASAGTGKTHTLVERIRAAILHEGVRPGAVLATTFTNRAADELAGRIRTRLIEAGHPELATQMLTARIGTVNAVAGALVAEFALELGRSPSSEVLAEDRVGPTFAEATGPLMYRHAETLAPLAERFEIPNQAYASFAGGTPGWRDQVHDIVDTARANGIGPDELPASAEHSVRTLLALAAGARPR
ncbi:MAG: UvrD-helicase domain-containing protein [Trueperaceae bacterium]|nr:UvrD-helicase domain-containing protein [Trueperaceae bacterium]